MVGQARDEVLNLEGTDAQVYCLLVKGCRPALILTTVRQAGDYKRQLEARAV